MTTSRPQAHLQSHRRRRVVRQCAHWLGRKLARFHYARHIEPTWLEINRLPIAVRGLPESFEGFRIVQLSDLHVGPKLTEAYLEEAIDCANAEGAELIALTGDFVHKGSRHVRRVAASVARLRAPHGVFAVLGNHDYSVRNALGIRRYWNLHRRVADALADVGIRVLRNESVVLGQGDDLLNLSGVDDLWSRNCDLDAVYNGHDPERPRVVLAHNPRTIERLKGRRCDFMMSGHTHGGQVNLPKFGRVALGKKTRRFAAGLYHHQGAALYVNKGIGFGWRFRYGVRPEIAVFTLGRAP
jgi:predicted MPP superfamily phosphohydrolase